MSKMEFLGALEVENLRKQKWEQYCGTPCNKGNSVILKDLQHFVIHLQIKKQFKPEAFF